MKKSIYLVLPNILLTGLFINGYGSDMEFLYKKYQETKDDRYWGEFISVVNQIFSEKKNNEKIPDKKDYLSQMKYFLDKYKETKDDRYWKKFMEIFHKKIERKKKKKIFTEEIKDKELLKLILQTFLGSNDLENAYIAAKKGKKLFPEDMYFTKYLADISLWLGKNEEALENYLHLYKSTVDEKLEEKILYLSLALRKYEVAKDLLEKKVNSGEISYWKELVYIYENLGEPEKAIDLLEKLYRKTKDRNILKKLIMLEVSVGDIGSLLEKMYQLKEISVKEAIEFSNILYLSKRYRDSLEILKSVKHKADPEYQEYWEILSDLAWALRDYETSFFASSILYYSRKARLIDYDRMIQYLFYKKKIKDLKNVALTGWRKYRKESFYYYYLYSLFYLQDYRGIIQSIKYLSKQDFNILKDKDYFWIYYGEALKRTGEIDKAIKVYEKGIYYTNSEDIILSYLWLLVDLKDVEKLETSLKKWEDLARNNEKFYLVYGAGYSILQNSFKASVYLKKLLKKYPENTDILILYADILDLSGKSWEAENYRFKVWKLMKKQLEEKPYKIKDEKFLKNYLYLSLYFEPAEKIFLLLKEAEKYLNEKELQEINITWHLMRNNQDTAKYLINRYKTSQPWMELNVALNYDDRNRMLYLLGRYSENLPIRDRVEAFLRTGNISSGETIAFKGLENNRYDVYLYRQMRDILMDYEDIFYSNLEYSLRRDISQIKWENKVRLSIDNLYILDAGFTRENIFFENTPDIVNLPSNLSSVYISIGKKKMRYNWNLRIAKQKRVKDFISFDFNFYSYLKDRFSIKISAGHNLEAQETIYLYYAGLKDKIETTIYHTLTSKTFLDFNLQYLKYRSQDKESLGAGVVFTAKGFRRLRAGYPDYTFYLYFRKGVYSEKENKGIINLISPYLNPVVLPESYNELGIGFSFGFEHKEKYTRVWRPFFETGLFLNDVIGAGFSMEAGIGGHILEQDHLSVGGSYFKGVQGTTDNILKMYINYFLLF
ncbi:tetratricopeptide repeat protein [Persephonella sp.]